jgi:hypothetical protein
VKANGTKYFAWPDFALQVTAAPAVQLMACEISISVDQAPRFARTFARALGQRVSELSAGLLGFGFQAFYDFEVLCGDIGRFTDIVY